MAINLFGDDQVKRANRARLSKPTLASQRKQGGAGAKDNAAGQGAVLGGEPVFLKGVQTRPALSNGNLVAPKGQPSPIPAPIKATETQLSQPEGTLSRPFTPSELRQGRAIINAVNPPAITKGFGSGGEGSLGGGNLTTISGESISANDLRNNDSAQNVFQGNTPTGPASAGIGGNNPGIQALSQEFRDMNARNVIARQLPQEDIYGNEVARRNAEVGARAELDLAFTRARNKAANIPGRAGKQAMAQLAELQAKSAGRPQELAAAFGQAQQKEYQDQYNAVQNQLANFDKNITARDRAIANASTEAAKLGLDYAKLDRQQQQDLFDQQYRNIQLQQKEKELGLTGKRIEASQSASEQRNEIANVLGLARLSQQQNQANTRNLQDFIKTITDPVRSIGMTAQQKVALGQLYNVPPETLSTFLTPEDIKQLGGTLGQ